MAKLTVPIRVDALEEAKSHAKEFYDKGYQQGRADFIKEHTKINAFGKPFIFISDTEYEQLKEQENE